jgi:hypothetical protein
MLHVSAPFMGHDLAVEQKHVYVYERQMMARKGGRNM